MSYLSLSDFLYTATVNYNLPAVRHDPESSMTFISRGDSNCKKKHVSESQGIFSARIVEKQEIHLTWFEN